VFFKNIVYYLRFEKVPFFFNVFKPQFFKNNFLNATRFAILFKITLLAFKITWPN